MKNETTFNNSNSFDVNNTTVNGRRSARRFSTKQIVLIGMLSALSYVLMLVKLPFSFLGFLEIEFSDIPALVAGLAYGPLTAVVIELIKNLIKVLTNTSTGGIGELANFVISSSYVVVSCGLFKMFRSKGMLKGTFKTGICFTFGTIAMTITGGLMNYYVLLPLYAGFMGGMDNIVGMASSTVSVISNPASLVIIGICPFNIFKGIYISIIGYILYKLFRKELNNL